MIDESTFKPLFDNLNIKCHHCNYKYAYHAHEKFMYEPNAFYYDLCPCNKSIVSVGDNLKYLDYRLDLTINKHNYKLSYDAISNICCIYKLPIRTVQSILNFSNYNVSEVKKLYANNYCPIQDSLDDIILKLSKRLSID